MFLPSLTFRRHLRRSQNEANQPGLHTIGSSAARPTSNLGWWGLAANAERSVRGASSDPKQCRRPTPFGEQAKHRRKHRGPRGSARLRRLDPRRATIEQPLLKAKTVIGNVCRAAPGMMAGFARVVHFHQDTAADQEKNGRDGNQKGPHSDLHVPRWIKAPSLLTLAFLVVNYQTARAVSKDFGYPAVGSLQGHRPRQFFCVVTGDRLRGGPSVIAWLRNRDGGGSRRRAGWVNRMYNVQLMRDLH